MKNILCLVLAGAVMAFAQAPKAGKVEVFPLDQVKAGMKATAWTVFEGSEVEAVPIEIIESL